MQKFKVTGMSCAACVARVERAVTAVSGVENCAVSLLTNSMSVEGNATPEAIVTAVEKAGYHAQELSTKNSVENRDTPSEPLADATIPLLKRRLAVSLAFLIPLLYFSMGHMMFGFPLPSWFTEPEMNHVAMGLVQLLLSGIILVINQKFFINGFKGIFNRAPNMDSLVALGAGASFTYSTAILFQMTRAQVESGVAGAEAFMDNFYFEGAATIVTLITVGKLLEAISKGRTTNALKSLMKLAPKQATLLVNGEEKHVEISEVKIGDIFIIKPGESIPVDGIILDGVSAINESALTGESLPVDKSVGDSVSAATINTSGFLKCKATRVGKDTTLSQIIQMVSDAAATKAPISKIADKISGIFVPTVIAIAVVTTIIWLLVDAEFGFALSRGIAVLVISCPCALGLATPVAIMVGSGIGAKNGILFKTSAALETTGRTQIVVLDKTGTITKGEPSITDIVTANGVQESELLQTAINLESKSEHPLARAICNYNKTQVPEDIKEFEAKPGMGLTAKQNGSTLLGGNEKFIASNVKISEEISAQIKAFSSQGKTPLLFAKNETLLGIIAVADTLKEDSAKAIAELKAMGIQVAMLTGDNETTAKAIGNSIGIDKVIAGVLPGGKDSAIQKLQKQGKVAMVGDGINDAPALTRADVGIAIGAGADVAIDAADIVLVKSSLADVSTAIKLSRKTIRNIHENLFWAFIYNVVGIPLAAGCYYHAFGLSLNATFAAAAMSLSSFCVVTNALRLNFFKTSNATCNNEIQNITSNKKQRNNMEKKYSVEGMMCPHCEAHVKKDLEQIDGITEAIPSHKENTVLVKLSHDVDVSVIKETIEKAGYKFKG